MKRQLLAAALSGLAAALSGTQRAVLGCSRVAALSWVLFLGLPGLPAQADEDPDDLMGGFDDEFDVSSLDDLEEEMPAWLAALPYSDVLYERVDLSGSVAAGTSYSYLDHKVPHGDQAGRSSSFGNLTRLDLDFFLQLDVMLPGGWLIRAEGLGWYDFMYHLKGRGDYGGEVIDVYEWQADTGEVYLSGPLGENLDITVGRKIVNWGRSDTFRVVDVINPLDHKEPGLVDIEDLRRPKAMIKLDAVSGPWSGQLLVIPESRYDRLPPRGSDFHPSIPAAFSRIPIHGRSDFDGTPGLAGKFDGRFSGWDFSLYGAYVDESRRVVDFELATGFRAESNRYGLVGAAGNITRGAWLVKAEVAWLTGLRILRVRPGSPAVPPVSDDKDRIDTMVGVEYYGRDSLNIALEVVNRSLLNYPGQPGVEDLTEQSTFETALRISRPFFRERLDVTALAIVIGERAQDGATLRLSGDYELTDDWKTEGGILIFIGGPDRGIGAFDSNDRLFAEIKYSF